MHSDFTQAETAASVYISDEVSLVSSPATGEGKTKGMAKGLFLRYRGRTFAGESAGFGLPVLKRRCHTFFPSLVSTRSISMTKCEMVFQLDRVERLHVLGVKIPNVFSWVVEPLLQAYMRIPKYQQSLLKVGETLRSRFDAYGFIVPGFNQGRCRVHYEVRDTTLAVEVDASHLLRRGQLIILNEVSGIPFDRLRIGERVWEGTEIPAWRIVPFGSVLESASAGCGFSIVLPDESAEAFSRLACGREVAKNLNWAGFALTTSQARCAYRVKFHHNEGK